MLKAFSPGTTELRFASVSDRSSSQEMFNFDIQISSRLQSIRIPIGGQNFGQFEISVGAQY